MKNTDYNPFVTFHRYYLRASYRVQDQQDFVYHAALFARETVNQTTPDRIFDSLFSSALLIWGKPQHE